MKTDTKVKYTYRGEEFLATVVRQHDEEYTIVSDYYNDTKKHSISWTDRAIPTKDLQGIEDEICL